MGLRQGRSPLEVGQDIRWRRSSRCSPDHCCIGQLSRPTIDVPAGFARKMNGKCNYVASNTMTEAGWTNTSILSGDIPAQVREIMAERGGDIVVHGRAGLVHTLLPKSLVDAVRLLV